MDGYLGDEETENGYSPDSVSPMDLQMYPYEQQGGDEDEEYYEDEEEEEGAEDYEGEAEEVEEEYEEESFSHEGGSDEAEDVDDENEPFTMHLEPVKRPQIIEYGFDGAERIATDYDLDEVTAALTYRIDWRSILGPDDTLEPLYSLKHRKEDEAPPEDVPEQSTSSARDPDDKDGELIAPAAGPWAEVANSLYSTLAEVNNLIDVIRIVKDGSGLMVATVQRPINDADNAVNMSKAFLWAGHRMASQEAIRVFNDFVAAQRKPIEQPLYFKELRELRELCIVRRVADNIIGDLGYRIYGSRWISQETFDVYRIELMTRSLGIKFNNQRVQTELEIDVPRHLAVRTCIFVSLERDTKGQDLFKKRVVRKIMRSEDNPVFPAEGDEAFAKAAEEPTSDEIEELEATGERPNLSRMAYWKNALTWARGTLFHRDLFSLLTRECAALVGRSCSIRDDIILVSLFDNLMLKIEKCEAPFVDGELADRGDAFLRIMLRSFFIDIASRPSFRSSFLVSLPNAQGKEMEVDGARSTSDRGFLARPPQPKTLIERIMMTAAHYHWMDKLVDVITQYSVDHRDPKLIWSWTYVTYDRAIMSVTFHTQGFEGIMKNTFIVVVSDRGVVVQPRDGAAVDCSHNMSAVVEQLHFQASMYCLNASISIASKIGFSMIQSQVNQHDLDYKSSPSAFFQNACSTVMVFEQFSTLSKEPTISVRMLSDTDAVGDQQHEAQFTPFNYSRLPGNTFLKKIENVFCYLRY